MAFQILATDKETAARRGVIQTRSGPVATPVFMPVGTAGSVKALTPAELENAGAQIILANTYHLFLRPGLETIRSFGSLQRFISWPKPILTDSGGFQIFSLRENAVVNGDGVRFKSHLDGSTFFLTPEDVVDIQNIFASDIQMALDYFAPFPAQLQQDELAAEITAQWAERARRHFQKQAAGNLQFGIVQGGLHLDLRERSLERLSGIGFDGYALGGLSIGESRQEFRRVVTNLLPLFPEKKPRYLMGAGMPEEILFAVSQGVDMFDCVLPSRNARNGTLFTASGRLRIKNEQYKMDQRPPDERCSCYTCRNFSRAYLRHLFMAREILSSVLNTIHNVHFYLDFLAKIRYAIELGTFGEFRESFLTLYHKGD